MDLWQLKIFYKVVELGSFSRAAEAVHLSQPTVSSHVKDLEEHFDCRLIDRMGKDAKPTKGGEILFDYARRLLDLAEEAETAIAAFMGKPTGNLAIGGSTIPGAYILPAAIGRFRGLYPDVCISLSISDTQEVADMVIDGKLEAGVVGALPADKRLEAKAVGMDEIRLVVPAGHPLAAKSEISVSGVVSLPLLIREPGSGTRRFLENALEKKGLDLSAFKVVAQLGSTEAVREAVKSGVGVSFLSTLAVEGELKSGVLAALDVPELELSRTFYLIRDGRRTPSPLCTAFMEFLLGRGQATS